MGITTTTGAYHAARTITTTGGCEATIILLADHEITSDANYSNLCFNRQNVTFDLRGYTLTDSNTHDGTMLYVYIKSSTTSSSVFTFKNGSIVLGADGLMNYQLNNRSYSFGLVFDNINFSWKDEGGSADHFIATHSYRSNFPLSFKNCTIDLENALDGIKLESGGALEGITFENTVIINSTDSKVYTSDESDIYDGSYIIGKYGPIPYLVSDAEEYSFVSYYHHLLWRTGKPARWL